MTIKAKVKVQRKVYGKPWSKLLGSEFRPPEAILRKMGQIIIDCIVEEAHSDWIKQGGGRTPRGEPEGIPGPPPFPTHKTAVLPEFLKSFYFEITGESTISILSSWPWIEQIVEGRDPYPMPWLTRERGVTRVPIVQNDGTVVFRMTPFRTADAWIHPGFARHTFINRGVRKGRERSLRLLREAFFEELRKGDPWK